MCLLQHLPFRYKIIKPAMPFIMSDSLLRGSTKKKKKEAVRYVPKSPFSVFNTHPFQCQTQLKMSVEMNEPDVNKNQVRIFLLTLLSACHIQTDGISILWQMT